MKRKLYIAYGSNLNLKQMKFRCPSAKLLGTTELQDYELQFKGHPHCAFATIAPKEGSTVPVAIWSLSHRDECSLDWYEGFPSHYFKKDLPIDLNGKELSAMVYIMNLDMKFGEPASIYYHTVREGYSDCGFNSEVLDKAVKNSRSQMLAQTCTVPAAETPEEPDESEDEGIGFHQLKL